MTTAQRKAALELTLSYHEQTKHHPHRYARSLGYLDWEDQPNPFREYPGAARVDLPLAQDEESVSYVELVSGKRGTAQELGLRALGHFFELSLALSAWKEMSGNRWALRINPSSGNLHPTEAYALLPPIEGIGSDHAAYHYVSRDHALELRTRWEHAGPHPTGATAGFYLALTSIPWREAWKYGERAFRYCQHDLGHALSAVSFAAATLGWKARFETVAPEYLTWLVGLEPPVHPLEPEIPEALIWVETGPSQPPWALPPPQAPLQWFGQPNQLSAGHQPWPLIDEVAAATNQPLDSGVPTRSESR